MPEGLVLVFIVGTAFVNGWTDAPNAIACAVSTGAMKYRKAAWMAGVLNLLGLLASYFAGAMVADTIFSLTSFEGDSGAALTALGAAMISVLVFAVIAWRAGIPTSESHALISALSGAGIALGGMASINPESWFKVITGLIISLLLGFGLGKLLYLMLGGAVRALDVRTLDRLQIFSAGGMAFMHGVQDGQKFVAIFIMADLLARGMAPAGAVPLGEHLAVVLLCGLTIALGTSVGGGRIVELVGNKMVQLDKPRGVCADISGAVCLLIASIFGIPMSTTHTKTTAMMGVAGRRADTAVVRGIVFTWVVTFPVCGLLGWGITRVLTLAASG